MSSILSLSRGYGSFFVGCTKFAVSPYTNTFMSIALARDQQGREDLRNVAAAAIVCGVLTFVIPILPAITSVTVALATIAMALAVATMFLTYPIALLADICDTSWEDSPHTHRHAF
ncbi:MAG: hypothetical protein PSV35_02780 [bacterium]|nr:hypothetical protein [bacterium]